MKQNLRPSDVVMVRVREKPAFYAQVRSIEPDAKRGWYRVTLRSVFGEHQWILEDLHLFLGQTWTFNGIPHRMERIKTKRGTDPRSAGRSILRRVK
jgi:hypothetical protein